MSQLLSSEIFKRTWLLILGILGIALLIRLPLMPQPLFPSDLLWNIGHGDYIYQHGLFNIYQLKDSDYPPLFLALLSLVVTLQHGRGVVPTDMYHLTDSFFIIMLKFFPVVADLLLIGAVALWLRHERVLRWLIPLLFALSPGVVLDSAAWGQSDSLMTLFLVLALIALNRDKPLSAWLFFGIAMLTKFQSVALFPLLVIVTYQRFGVRRLMINIGLTAVLAGCVLLPFALNSGISETLTPYVGAVGEYPVVTVNAFNLWYVLSPHKLDAALPWPTDKAFDIQVLIGSVTLKQVGLLLFGVYVLCISAVMLRQASQRREFIWAAAIYFGFFMLPTEIHERYLYPACVFLLIGLVQDRRLWFAALLTAFTFTYNLALVLTDTGVIVLLPFLASLVNLSVFVMVIYLAVIPPRAELNQAPRQPEIRPVRPSKLGFAPERINHASS